VVSLLESAVAVAFVVWFITSVVVQWQPPWLWQRWLRADILHLVGPFRFFAPAPPSRAFSLWTRDSGLLDGPWIRVGQNRQRTLRDMLWNPEHRPVSGAAKALSDVVNRVENGAGWPDVQDSVAFRRIESVVRFHARTQPLRGALMLRVVATTIAADGAVSEEPILQTTLKVHAS
jgi:hypothetical protein